MCTVNASVARTIFKVVDFGTVPSLALIALSSALIAIIGWTFLQEGLVFQQVSRMH